MIVLHLLLIPGTAFLVGGARIWEQNLHPHRTQLNLSLLAVGVLSIVLPTAFFAALDHGGQSIAANDQPAYPGTVISDDMRDRILRMSRGFAILLLLVYVGSRIFLHVTPGEDKTTTAASLAEKADEREEPELHPLACVIMLIITVGLMAATAEFVSTPSRRKYTDAEEVTASREYTKCSRCWSYTRRVCRESRSVFYDVLSSAGGLASFSYRSRPSPRTAVSPLVSLCAQYGITNLARCL